MSNAFLLSFVSFLLFVGNNGHTPTKTNTLAADEMICGKWQNTDKNIIVDVYKEGAEFKAKLVWFNNGEGERAMESWTDKHNPDPALRSRKLLGMNILEKLVYDPETKSWEDGIIYDAQNGRHWNSSARIDKHGELKVKGYWHIKLIGKTMTFNRL
ncbi:DUF2147 domain-containing protein [Mucilaginibacter pedocola]|uniref:DUF2147 domain-containing protein n=1 Tax=Mucilaginibacter pedocola TaxID=1792845 RepID=A0A1S9PE77_9SPHI|nr:DUF2147 domain-containing protein [Mucilaginibacter pedocola]OOQ59254.1 hypothetical protein BC343_28445 [Mucilaginibacter pedocola]